MPKDKNSFAARVKALREGKAMSATDLAKLANVSAASVWQWEKNGTMPRPSTVSTIASKLGVTAEYLLTGDGCAAIDPVIQIDTRLAKTAPQGGLENASLEELMNAIKAKGFDVRIASCADNYNPPRSDKTQRVLV